MSARRQKSKALCCLSHSAHGLRQPERGGLGCEGIWGHFCVNLRLNLLTLCLANAPVRVKGNFLSDMVTSFSKEFVMNYKHHLIPYSYLMNSQGPEEDERLGCFEFGMLFLLSFFIFFLSSFNFKIIPHLHNTK